MQACIFLFTLHLFVKVKSRAIATNIEYCHTFILLNQLSTVLLLYRYLLKGLRQMFICGC
jgi:hypothetical protein